MTKQEKLVGLNPFLSQRVIGQPEAIGRTTLALQGAEYRLNDTGARPKASFLFMGPSGVGKTATTKAFTEHLFGMDRFVFLPMNQFQSGTSARDFVDALCRAASSCPEGGTILCDEIEKGTKDVTDILLSVLDEGQVLLPSGDRSWFSKFYLVFTSNLGSDGFSKMHDTSPMTMRRYAYDKAKEKLRPEWFYRLTETIVFRPLSTEVQVSILDKLVAAKVERLHAVMQEELNQGLAPFDFSHESVRPYLLNKAFTSEAGARHLREQLNREFAAAIMPYLLNLEAPKEGRFYGDPAWDRLILK